MILKDLLLQQTPTTLNNKETTTPMGLPSKDVSTLTSPGKKRDAGVRCYFDSTFLCFVPIYREFGFSLSSITNRIIKLILNGLRVIDASITYLSPQEESVTGIRRAVIDPTVGWQIYLSPLTCWFNERWIPGDRCDSESKTYCRKKRKKCEFAIFTTDKWHLTGAIGRFTTNTACYYNNCSEGHKKCIQPVLDRQCLANTRRQPAKTLK